jgi:DNA repair exonuclease SbcCD ATPase subunit
MIKFKTLRYRNFLSTGDNFTEILLGKSRSTLVVGQNGAGKSTMLDALSFALFGKAHRNINKNQLINSINNKAMVVEVEFDIGPANYKIVRGVKPAKFEIWKDNTLVNQDSHNKEYQKVLEQNILKLNHKSFHQIVVLGSSSFVPFMQLPAQHRREVIEDLLDINVFSKMNQILKEKTSILKESIKQNGHSAELIKTKIDSQKKYLRDITALSAAHLQEKKDAIETANAEIDQLTEKNRILSESVGDSLPAVDSGIAKIRKNINDLRIYENSFKTKGKTLAKEILFFENNEHCPSCEQPIAADLRLQKKEDGKRKAAELQEAMEKAQQQLQIFNDKEASLSEQYEAIQKSQSEISTNNNVIRRLQKDICELQEQIDEINTGDGNLQEAKTQLDALTEQMQALLDESYELNESFSYQQVCSELLKDTGIKTKIIKQYIPVINNLVNKYLQVLDFYVSFYLDDTFKESIRSRYRDEFSYDSFSEGEKQRIDLALLFTWRMVARMKNSVATNLLILDETFDSSLDADGVDNLTKILETLDDETCVFIISHKGDLLDGKFDDKIEFVKHKNFSKIA